MIKFNSKYRGTYTDYLIYSPWQEEEATKDVDAFVDDVEDEGHRTHPIGHRWSCSLGIQGSRRR